MRMLDTSSGGAIAALHSPGFSAHSPSQGPSVSSGQSTHGQGPGSSHHSYIHSSASSHTSVAFDHDNVEDDAIIAYRNELRRVSLCLFFNDIAFSYCFRRLNQI